MKEIESPLRKDKSEQSFLFPRSHIYGELRILKSL